MEINFENLKEITKLLTKREVIKAFFMYRKNDFKYQSEKLFRLTKEDNNTRNRVLEDI